MDGEDPFFTPSTLAQEIAAFATCPSPSIVADFAAGEGALLDAAVNRWPTTTVVATDLNAARLKAVRAQRPEWLTGRVNFLSRRSRAASDLLRSLEGRVDVILLNPPFSIRGAARFGVDLEDSLMQCGKAMAFLLESVQYLAPGGEIVAVLPSGSLHGARDEEAWRYLRKRYEVAVLNTPPTRSFSRVAASTGIVRIARRPATLRFREQSNRAPLSLPDIAAEIRRGTVQVHLARQSEGELPLIHTTSLRRGRVQEPLLWTSRGAPLVGPGVVFPRVGAVTQEKLSILDAASPVVLSDCVIALRTSDATEAVRLRELLLSDWDVFRSLFGGTGAQYTTIAKVTQMLHALGVSLVTSIDPISQGLSQTHGLPPLVDGWQRRRPARWDISPHSPHPDSAPVHVGRASAS